MSTRAVFLLALFATVTQLVLLPVLTEASKDANSAEKPETQKKERVSKATLKADIVRLQAQINRLSQAASAQDLTYLDDNRILVFRISAGVGTSAYGTYTSAGLDTDRFRSLAGCGCRTVNGTCNTHYRSGLLDLWPSTQIDTVRVSVYKQGKEVAFVEFNGQGSDKTNWFSADRVVASSWTDIKTQPHNYFSIEGHSGSGHERRFFISRSYGGCPGDLSWLVVTDKQDPCTWGQGNSYPIILYSKVSTYGNVNNAAQYDKADVLTVTIKLKAGAATAC